MKAIGDLPSEVLDEIFSNLDGESMIVASKVCLLWRRVVHEFTSLRASKCDTELKEKLEKCGWIFGEHDFEYCKCIELNIGLFKLIGSESLSCQEIVSERQSTSLYLLSKNKLFAKGFRYGAGILMYDLRQGKLEQSYLLDENPSHRRVLAARVQDQTLVIKDYDNDSKDGRIMVWNLKTFQNVSELNFRGKAFEFTGDRYCRIDLVNIAIGRHKLAVHLEIRGKFGFELQHRITQIWMLDTDNPSTENIHYLTTIEHDLGFMNEAEGKLSMNSKLLCLQANKIFEREIFLNVFLIDDLSTSTTTSIGRFWFRDFQIDIEEGFSNRIAVFNRQDNILKVYKFFDDNDVFCLDVNLNPVVSMNPGSLLMANFLMGKIMFISNSVRQFQCIIVTEEGEVIEGNKQEFQLGPVGDVAFNAYGIVAKKIGFSGSDSRIIFFK